VSGTAQADLFLTGGTGFVGGAVLHAARAAGMTIRALHRPSTAVPADGNAAQWFSGELLDPRSWVTARRVVKTVVHAAAAVRGAAEELHRINVEGTRAVLEAAVAAAVSRFVFVSSAVVTDGDEDPYAESKRAAERVLHGTSIETVVLRPTLVCGAGDRSNLPRFLGRMRRLPIYPVFGCLAIQPVFAQDVAAAILAAATTEGIAGKTYDLGGDHPIPFATFLRGLARAAGLPPPRILRLPLAPLRWVAPVLDRASGSRRFSRMVHYYERDHVYDLAPARRDLGFRPRGWEEGLAALRLEV